MKKKNLLLVKTKRWNKLLRQFQNLYERLKSRYMPVWQQKYLLQKLNKIYKNLERLQKSVGVKVAGTALALMLVSANSTAQDFTFRGYLTQTNQADITLSFSSPAFADLNNDGNKDLYIGDADGYINFYQNQGNGNFDYKGYVKAGQNAIDIDAWANPAFADIDQDGDLDMYVGQYYGIISVFTNDGNGNFTDAGTLLLANSDTLQVKSLAIPTFADIDNDGDLDLYVGEYYGKIFVYINDGNGNFTDNGPLLLANGNTLQVEYFAIPIFADIDQDGDLDLYVGDYYGKIFVYKNDGNANFTDNGPLLLANGDTLQVEYLAIPTFADIDQDGDLDLYVGDYYGNLSVFTNDGNGNFSRASSLQATNQPISIRDRYSCPALADLDNDNDLDLFINDRDGIKFFENDGTGHFSANSYLMSNSDTVHGGISITFADFDNDNDIDLFIPSEQGITYYINDGNNNFTDSGYILADGDTIVSNSYGSIVFEDLDQDGDMDLFTLNDDTKIKIYTNDGNGNFSNSGNLVIDGDTTTSDFGYLKGFDFVDWDKDNDLDLLAGAKIYLNDGSNTNFTFHNYFTADNDTIYLYRPQFGDIDNDGDIDLLRGTWEGLFLLYKNTEIASVNNIKRENLSVYPNPSSGIFNISTKNNVSISVFDITGKLILSENDISQIDLSAYEAGIYVLKIQTGSNIITKKIIKK